MALLLGGGALALSSSSSYSSSELSTTGCSPSGSEMRRTWVLREVATVVLLPTRDGSLQSSSGSSWGSPDAAASPATATKIVAGSRPVVPGGFDTLTRVPSELITTGGYLESDRIGGS